jgi:hypothetical protein
MQAIENKERRYALTGGFSVVFAGEIPVASKAPHRYKRRNCLGAPNNAIS